MSEYNGYTGAVIVAAGLSSRMGEYKPLMKLGGETIARRVVGAFAKAGVRPIVVVTGHRADELEAHLTEYMKTFTGAQADTGTHGQSADSLDQNYSAASGPPPIHFIRNDAFASTPMFESAKIGLSYIADKCARTFFCPIDVPLFTSDTVRALMDYRAAVAKPVHNESEGHPILIDAKLIPQIIGAERTRSAEAGEIKITPGEGAKDKADSYGGMKGALAIFENVTKLVEVPDDGILYDADTPEDIASMRNRMLYCDDG